MIRNSVVNKIDVARVMVLPGMVTKRSILPQPFTGNQLTEEKY
ncbi:hypothetical protein LDG_9081 [Legionella drancourtii LLAP12]|uniref:Uncharacterized protein n=1 Tax=Legionella drancourtii LLAP12 TaxID=658187 RepID=G9EUT1_9GAMM|nr:hypothetical protein LDG_9081 [Legionella drancourtii LLAP12]